MRTSRREFLEAAGLSFISLSAFAPRLFAQAAQSAARADANDRVLVVIELTGGNDGLNTVIPFENDLYYKNRRTLGIPKTDVLRIADEVGLHPSLAPLRPLFDEGALSIVQGAGYPQPDRSHFRSMEIWHTASTSSKVPETGWLGRAVDNLPGIREEAFLPGLAVTSSLPQACQAEKYAFPVVGELDVFAGSDQPGQPDSAVRRRLSTSTGSANAAVGFVRRQSGAIYRTVERLKEAQQKYRSTVEYPTSALGTQLKRAAQILAGDLGVRVLYATHDNYDTHSGQAETHGALLADLAQSLAAFQSDLQTLGQADRVATFLFSEFGRRVDENASAGTDHGAASCVFVVGRRIKGGLYGEYPALDKLDEGDLIYTTDFRRVYASLLDGWLGCPAATILGASYDRLGFV